MKGIKIKSKIMNSKKKYLGTKGEFDIYVNSLTPIEIIYCKIEVYG